MRRIKQLLTMRLGTGASIREIARELGVAPSTVREYLGRAAAAGIGWPLAADMTDESLMARLFVKAGVRAGARHHAEPDWAALVRELKRPGVNLLVLWEEYRAVHPEGYAYSRYVAAKVMSRTLGKTSDMADFPGSVATYKGVFEWCATTPMIDGPNGATSLSRCEPP